MKNWYPGLKRGEDPERDARLDTYFGCVEIGPTQCVVAPDGSTLLGHMIREYGYDGSVVSEKCTYNTRLTGLSAAKMTEIAHMADVKVTDAI